MIDSLVLYRRGRHCRSYSAAGGNARRNDHFLDIGVEYSRILFVILRRLFFRYFGASVFLGAHDVDEAVCAFERFQGDALTEEQAHVEVVRVDQEPACAVSSQKVSAHCSTLTGVVRVVSPPRITTPFASISPSLACGR